MTTASAWSHSILLRIWHPSIDPNEISDLLQLHPDVAAKSGDSKVTSSGRTLVGVYKSNFWGYSQDYARSEAGLFSPVQSLLGHLYGRREFFQRIAASGGKSEIYLQVCGAVNIGDTMPSAAMAAMVDLGIDFSIEVFPEKSH